MNNKTYDILKWIILVVSPALCTLIVTLNMLWNWSLPIDAIVGSISAITTFAGVVLGISSINYAKRSELNDY